MRLRCPDVRVGLVVGLVACGTTNAQLGSLRETSGSNVCAVLTLPLLAAGLEDGRLERVNRLQELRQLIDVGARRGRLCVLAFQLAGRTIETERCSDRGGLVERRSTHM